jgi:hypothetical protein
VDRVVRFEAPPHAPTTGRLRDVSLSGAYVEGVPFLPILSQVTLDLERLEGDRRALNRVAAHVVRNETGGVGLEWDEFAPEAVRTLIAASEESIGRVGRRERPRAAFQNVRSLM